jgi:hypothetical protein
MSKVRPAPAAWARSCPACGTRFRARVDFSIFVGTMQASRLSHSTVDVNTAQLPDLSSEDHYASRHAKPYPRTANMI